MADMQSNNPENANIFFFGFDANLNRINVFGNNPLLYDPVSDIIAPQYSSQSNVIISGASKLQSDNFISGKRGWRIDSIGDIETGSVIFNREFVFTSFESLDGFVTVVSSGSSLNVRLGSLRFATGAGLGQRVQIVNDNLSIHPLRLLLKDSFFETVLAIPTLTGDAYISLFGVGDLLSGDTGSMRGYGFRVYNGALSGLYVDGSTESTIFISGITLGNSNVYVAKNSVINKTINYFVNGELRASLPTNFSAGQPETRFSYDIRNTGTVNREMYVNHATFAQDQST